MGKITITNSSFTNVRTAYKIEGDVELNADSNVYNNVGTVLDVKPAEMPESMKALIAAVQPLGATPEEIRDALILVRDASAGERAAAVEGSQLWPKVKEKLPDAAALVIKTAIEFWKLNA